MTDTYESLRESVGGTAGEAWRAADRAEANLRSLYQELKDDPRYTEEHKAATAWERYEATKDKITADKEKARELLQKQLRSAERLSVPLPGSEAVNTTDTDKLLASQNEATRLVRRIDRLEAGAKGPFKPDRVNVLKEQYQRGLEVGGVQGGAICRGVLLACEELGVDTNAVVDPFRKQTHRDSLEHAQHVERLLFTVGGKPPEPPFPRPGRTRSPKDVGTYGGRRVTGFLDRKDSQEPIVVSQPTTGGNRRRSKAPWK
jgi:hypothetical protein